MDNKFYNILSINDLNNETWAKCDILPENYLVSNLGRIKSLGKEWSNNINTRIKTKERILKQHKMKSGYLSISLSNKKLYTIHRLVALCFLGKNENKKYVNHIDGNKENNMYSNLEWCTIAENNKHAFDIGLKKAYNKGFINEKSIHSKRVLCLNNNKEYPSVAEIGRALNIRVNHVSEVCNGKRKKVKGLSFIYL
jgi:hypothetical protein